MAARKQVKSSSGAERAPAAFVPYAGEDPRRLRISVTTIGDLLLTAADRDPDKLALVFPEACCTYGELASRALRRARSLQALGVRPREHVGILMHSCPEFVELYFAIALCGAVIVPINARYKATEISYLAENGDLVTLVTTDATAEQVNFAERLEQTFPDLASQANARRLRLATAPKLRNIVLLGKSHAPGFVTEKDFMAAGEDRPEDRVHETRLRVRVRDNRHFHRLDSLGRPMTLIAIQTGEKQYELKGRPPQYPRRWSPSQPH